MYRCTHQQCGAADACLQRLSSQEAEAERLQKAEAVHLYKEAHAEKREGALREEIALLKQRLDDSTKGRHYEHELYLDKVNALKVAEEVRTFLAPAIFPRPLCNV